MVIVCLRSRHVVDVFVILNEQNLFYIYNHLIKKENLCVSYTYLHVYHLSLMVDKESHMSYVDKSKQTWMTEGNLRIIYTSCHDLTHMYRCCFA